MNKILCWFGFHHFVEEVAYQNAAVSITAHICTRCGHRPKDERLIDLEIGRMKGRDLWEMLNTLDS